MRHAAFENAMYLAAGNRNLEALGAVTNDMPINERHLLEARFLGVLSVVVPAEIWEEAVKRAWDSYEANRIMNDQLRASLALEDAK